MNAIVFVDNADQQSGISYERISHAWTLLLIRCLNYYEEANANLSSKRCSAPVFIFFCEPWFFYSMTKFRLHHQMQINNKPFKEIKKIILPQYQYCWVSKIFDKNSFVTQYLLDPNVRVFHGYNEKKLIYSKEADDS